MYIPVSTYPDLSSRSFCLSRIFSSSIFFSLSCSAALSRSNSAIRSSNFLLSSAFLLNLSCSSYSFFLCRNSLFLCSISSCNTNCRSYTMRVFFVLFNFAKPKWTQHTHSHTNVGTIFYNASESFLFFLSFSQHVCLALCKN